MLSHTCLTTKEPLRALQFKPIINLAHRKRTKKLLECYEMHRSIFKLLTI